SNRCRARGGACTAYLVSAALVRRRRWRGGAGRRRRRSRTGRRRRRSGAGRRRRRGRAGRRRRRSRTGRRRGSSRTGRRGGRSRTGRRGRAVGGWRRRAGAFLAGDLLPGGARRLLRLGDLVAVLASGALVHGRAGLVDGLVDRGAVLAGQLGG